MKEFFPEGATEENKKVIRVSEKKVLEMSDKFIDSLYSQLEELRDRIPEENTVSTVEFTGILGLHLFGLAKVISHVLFLKVGMVDNSDDRCEELRKDLFWINEFVVDEVARMVKDLHNQRGNLRH